MKQIKITIPDQWNNLSDQQLFAFHKLMLKGIKGKKFDVKVFRLLAAKPWYFFKHKAKLTIVLANVPATELRNHIAFIYDTNTRTKFPKLRTRNSFLKSRALPMESLSNMTVGEFSIADDLHIKWRVTQDVNYLHALAACLYSTATHPRPEFDKNYIPFWMKHFAKLPLPQLLAIEQAFHGTKEGMAAMYKNVFPKPKEATSEAPAPNPRAYSEFPQFITMMAGGKFGNYEQTMRTNIYTFLSELESHIKELKKNRK